MGRGASKTTLRRHGTIKPGGRSVVLGEEHPAVVDGRTLFPSTVKPAGETMHVLKSGHHQRKIGKVVQKGKWRGFPIYTLTLEERATCPRTCHHWRSCYGNNMHMAERIVADAEFEELLWDELKLLNRQHRGGFVVRLHVLGDFYSVDYVRLWKRALDTFPALHVFGYTARTDREPIGREITSIAMNQWDRFAVRFSGWDKPVFGAVTVEHGEETDHVICPAQTGGTDCCATCGFFWQSERTVAFLSHGGSPCAPEEPAPTREVKPRAPRGSGPSTLQRFAEALAEHDLTTGDRGGHVPSVARRLGLTPTYGNSLLQRMRQELGPQAI